MEELDADADARKWFAKAKSQARYETWESIIQKATANKLNK